MVDRNATHSLGDGIPGDGATGDTAPGDTAAERTRPWQAGPGPLESGGLARLGDYALEREVARGGMGTVYLGRDAAGQPVAVKVLDARAEADPAGRHEVEALAAARLDHPGFVRTRAIGRDAGRWFLVMEWVEGETLAERIAREGRLGVTEAARTALALGRALAHAHARGVLHRDLKPRNVLLDRTGSPRIADFGVARLRDTLSRTATGAVLGTPAYMPPEQAAARSDRVSERSDVYGLGAILYEMLTGRAPFPGTSLHRVLLAVLTQPPRAPRELRPELDPVLEAICLRCLAKLPEDRYPSAEALAAALEAWLQSRAARRAEAAA